MDKSVVSDVESHIDYSQMYILPDHDHDSDSDSQNEMSER